MFLWCSSARGEGRMGWHRYAYLASILALFIRYGQGYQLSLKRPRSLQLKMQSSSTCEVSQEERTVSAFMRRTSIVAATIVGAAVLVEVLAGSPYAHHSVPRAVPVVHADSTGKMSTKLTARKRYLPRIAEGVRQFNALATGDEVAATTFLKGEKPGYEGFVRAMSLFGASLRVGETPDKVSREAEDIVTAFNKEIVKVASSKSALKKVDLQESASLLKKYIEFAEQHVASPIDHYEVKF